MIIYNTPYKDALTVMLSEWEKVGYFIGKTNPKVIKYFSHRRNAGTLHVDKYTVPASNNTYYVVSKLNLDDQIKTWCYLKTDGDNGRRRVYVLRKNDSEYDQDLIRPQWILDVYTGHFWSRYRERTNANVDGDLLITHFLTMNNRRGIALPAYMVNPAIEEDENQLAIITDEGLCFTQSEEATVNGMRTVINENKTFVAKDNVFFQQAITLQTTDWYLKSLRLRKAQMNGADAATMVDILNSGFFEPVQRV